MFNRRKNWVQVQALVLDKKVYASKQYSGDRDRLPLRAPGEVRRRLDV